MQIKIWSLHVIFMWQKTNGDFASWTITVWALGPTSTAKSHLVSDGLWTCDVMTAPRYTLGISALIFLCFDQNWTIFELATPMIVFSSSKLPLFILHSNDANWEQENKQHENVAFSSTAKQLNRKKSKSITILTCFRMIWNDFRAANQSTYRSEKTIRKMNGRWF